jgi:hypothetical protein
MVIALNFISMRCETFKLIWLYIGLIFGGVFMFWSAKHFIHLRCQDTVATPKFISDFENKFNVKIKILSSQKIKAFVYKKNIYISMGLLERLDSTELEAVLAHEVYHVRYSPNKFLSSILALTSLTFKRHNDDPRADLFAARVTGHQHLINAFQKLQIIDREKRIRKLNA